MEKRYILTWIHTKGEDEYKSIGSTFTFATRKQRRNFEKKYVGGLRGRWLKSTTTSATKDYYDPFKE